MLAAHAAAGLCSGSAHAPMHGPHPFATSATAALRQRRLHGKPAPCLLTLHSSSHATGKILEILMVLNWRPGEAYHRGEQNCLALSALSVPGEAAWEAAALSRLSAQPQHNPHVTCKNPQFLEMGINIGGLPQRGTACGGVSWHGPPPAWPCQPCRCQEKLPGKLQPCPGRCRCWAPQRRAPQRQARGMPGAPGGWLHALRACLWQGAACAVTEVRGMG